VVGIIVSQLDVADRLTAGRVCRSWRRIARSPHLWRQDLTGLPQSPSAIHAGLSLLSRLAQPSLAANNPGGFIIGRNQRDLHNSDNELPLGHHQYRHQQLLRPPHSDDLGVNLHGFPYTFGPEQGLMSVPAPQNFVLPLPSERRPPRVPYRPGPQEVDLTPLFIERQLLRQWVRFDEAVRVVVPHLEAMVQRTLARNRRAVAAMHIQTAATIAELEQNPGPTLRAYDQRLRGLEVTARFLEHFSGYPAQERWHVYPPRWLPVALGHGWLTTCPRIGQPPGAAAEKMQPFRYLAPG